MALIFSVRSDNSSLLLNRGDGKDTGLETSPVLAITLTFCTSVSSRFNKVYFMMYTKTKLNRILPNAAINNRKSMVVCP